MSTRIIILFAAATIAYVSAQGNEEQGAVYTEVVFPHVLNCAKEFPSTLDFSKQGQESGSGGGVTNCLMNCVFKALGVINENGLYDLEKAENLAKTHLKVEQNVKNFGNVAKLCAKVNDAQIPDGDKSCERAALLFKCALDNKGTLLLN